MRPFAPVRRPEIEPLFGRCVDPSAKDSSARKDKCVLAVAIKNGEFDVDIEWCGHPNGLPRHVRFLNRRHKKAPAGRFEQPEAFGIALNQV